MGYVNASTVSLLGRIVVAVALAGCGADDLADLARQPAGPVSIDGAHPSDVAISGPGSGLWAEAVPAPAAGRVDRLAPPSVEALPANTWRLAVTIKGTTLPNSAVFIDGAATDAVGRSDDEGRFVIGLELAPRQPNRIKVTTLDALGVMSLPSHLTVIQDADPVRTRHPIVLHHGYMGFRELLGVPYFWDVVEHLEAVRFDVRTTEVPPLADVQARAGKLVEQIRRITSGPVNLICHSMGGLDARYAVSIGGLRDQVATLTTVGTPHRGTPIADLVLGGRDELAAEWLLETLGIPAGGLNDLSVKQTTEVFNKQVIDVPGVQYFSWSSVSDPFGVRTGAPLNPLFMIPYLIVEREEGDNDGLVSTTSAKWGTHLGTFAADHLDQVGHLLGLTDQFDHLEFWKNEAERLQSAGF